MMKFRLPSVLVNLAAALILPAQAAYSESLPQASQQESSSTYLAKPAIALPARVPASPANVLILANSNMAESMELANYYAEKRGIPKANIIALPMSEKERFHWNDFKDQIWNPLHTWLLENKWIKEEGEQLTDKQGRTHGRVINHRIDWLVTCYGVPLRIFDDKRFINEESQDEFRRLIGAPAGEKAQELNKFLRISHSSVDSELAAMPTPNNPLLGFVPNPLYNNANTFLPSHIAIIRTARIDGPDFLSARSLVDSALKGEKEGLRGRAYIDSGGPYALANKWMDNIANMLRSDNWDVTENKAKGTFKADDRFDAPALYFGWYTRNANGPFKEPGMRFAPGAIAMHLQSFSATTMRDDKDWAPAIVKRGAAGTIGNVTEPLLAYTHNFEVIAKALREGWSFGEACWLSMPVMSWQGVIIGDPLYIPFPIEEPNATNSGAPGSPRVGTEDQYDDIRKIIALEQDGESTKALAYAKECFKKRPGYAIALKLAQMQKAEGNNLGAEMSLSFMAMATNMDCAQRSVALEAARFLANIGDQMGDKLALRILYNLREMDISANFKKAVTKEGYEIVKRSGSATELLEWKTD